MVESLQITEEAQVEETTLIRKKTLGEKIVDGLKTFE